MNSNARLDPAQTIKASSLMRESYAADGYVIAKGIFDPALLALLYQSFHNQIEDERKDNDSQFCMEGPHSRHEIQGHDPAYRATQSVGSSATVYELLGSSGIFDIVSTITGFDASDLDVTPPYLMVQRPSDDRSDCTWLLDGSFCAWCQEFLTLWFPVSYETDHDTGTISVIPGSHRYDPLEKDNFLRYGVFRQIPTHLDGGTGEKTLNLKPGDCCILNSNSVYRMVASRCATHQVAGILHIASRSGYRVGGFPISPESI